jgi:hypothetical protein
MAKFTQNEANECIIIKCDSFQLLIERILVHQYWDIEVQDNNGNIYRILNYELGSDASNNDIKNFIRERLLETEKIAPPQIRDSSNISKDIIGQTIG